MTSAWRSANRHLYRLAHRLQRWRAAWRWHLSWPVRGSRPAHPSSPQPPIVYLQNGRLGDSLLAAAFVARYRDWFGKVIAVGRPETAAVTAPLVDRFVAIPPGLPRRATIAALRRAIGETRGVFGDLHLCSGNPVLERLAAELPGPVVVYDGWIDRSLQAPFRGWPTAATVVESLPKGALRPGAPGLHVWNDLLHYHRRALPLLGVAKPRLPIAPSLPESALDPRALHRRSLPAGFVACQPGSAQQKKDWPEARWRELWTRFHEVAWVVLGLKPKDAAPVALANVVDLRSQTSVSEAFAIVGAARAFVGVDSAFAHAAAIAGVPTTVVMPQATPGWFFPYPRDLTGIDTTAVLSQEHEACAGCGGLCSVEPLWRSRSQGFPCLRAVDVDAVAARLGAVLARGRAQQRQRQPT